MPNKHGLGVFVILLILAIISLLYLNYKQNQKDYPIYTNIQTPQGYPEIMLSDITSGNLNNFLVRAQKAGKFPKFFSTVKPMTRFQALSTEALTWVYASIEIFRWDVEHEIYLSPEVKPYQFVAYYKTKFGNEVYYVLIEEWLNKDKSYSFVPYVVSESRFIADGKVDPYYLDMVSPSSIWFPSPMIYIKNKAGCLKVVGSGKEYCNWYVSNLERHNKDLGTWPNSTSVPKIIGRYPILVWRSPLTLNIPSQ